MGIFTKISLLFQKNKPHRELLGAYSEVHRLASMLLQALAVLRKTQKGIAGAKKTGGMGLQKTLFIEEELMPRLQELSKKAEQRFIKAMEKEHEQQPLSPLEKEELARIIEFLKKVQQRLPDFDALKTKQSTGQVLLAVEIALRDINNLAKEFHTIEKYEKDLVRRILHSEISRLLRRIYEKPEVGMYREQGRQKPMYLAKISGNELRALDQEAQRINAAMDPKYRILWRRWWRDIQIPERDATTPLKDPHINVSITLDGKKKDIHLLLAA